MALATRVASRLATPSNQPLDFLKMKEKSKGTVSIYACSNDNTSPHLLSIYCVSDSVLIAFCVCIYFNNAASTNTTT